MPYSTPPARLKLFFYPQLDKLIGVYVCNNVCMQVVTYPQEAIIIWNLRQLCFSGSLSTWKIVQAPYLETP